MEKVPNQEKPISPEEFFKNKIEVYRVSKENFVKLTKKRNPTMDEDKILQAKGINFENNGKVVILIRTDIYPEEYIPYLETHEKWEAYIARKDGFNLWKKSTREYQEQKGVNLNDKDSQNQFLKEVAIYNYDFRHEYAIYKEYQQAMVDGKLGEYYTWFMDLRKKEKLNTSDTNLQLIENDTKIRESIYRKLKEGAPHIFTRD